MNSMAVNGLTDATHVATPKSVLIHILKKAEQKTNTFVMGLCFHNRSHQFQFQLPSNRYLMIREIEQMVPFPYRRYKITVHQVRIIVESNHHANLPIPTLLLE